MADDVYEHVRVYFDLPNHWATGGETMWATPEGDDLYRLDNVPFHAYGVNCGDIVRANLNEDGILEVREVVTPSGNETFRIVFYEVAGSRQRQDEILDSMLPLNVSFERMSANYVAIDVPPEADYDAVRARLTELQAEDLIGYETCEMRVPGSFDATPEDQ